MKRPGTKPYLSESDYRGILENGLKDLYPELRSGELDHLYAPKRDIRDGEAFLYAGGDFVIENAAGTMYQKAWGAGVFCSHSANTWREDSCLWLPASDDPGLHDQGDRSNCKRAFRIDGRPLDFQTTARLLTLLNNSGGCRPSRASIGRLRFSPMVSPRMRR